MQDVQLGICRVNIASLSSFVGFVITLVMLVSANLDVTLDTVASDVIIGLEDELLLDLLSLDCKMWCLCSCRIR